MTDDEWAFVSSYLVLMDQDAPQRTHDLREVFNALRWIVRTGAPWSMLPHDLLPWTAVYQQTQHWLRAGVFETMVHTTVFYVGKGRGSCIKHHEQEAMGGHACPKCAIIRTTW